MLMHLCKHEAIADTTEFDPNLENAKHDKNLRLLKRHIFWRKGRNLTLMMWCNSFEGPTIAHVSMYKYG